MGRELVLGVDVGTSSCKVTAVDIDGEVVSSGDAAYPTSSPGEGWAEQDPDAWLPAIRTAIRDAGVGDSISPAEVLAVGLTSAAHVTVLLGADGLPLRDAILWSDTRSAEAASALDSAHGAFIRETTCNAIGTTWSLAHLVWVRANEPEIWKQVDRICLSKDFVACQLTGAFTTDNGTATSALLFDANRGRWSEEICSWLEISPGRLPSLAPVRQVIGRLLPSAAAVVGLVPGTPVVNGTLDSATETYAAGALSAGEAVIRLGTAGGIHVVSESPFADRRLITYPHPSVPLWYSQAGTSAAGASIEWARGLLGGGRLLGHEEFVALAGQANPGADGVLFHPYLSGERCPYWNSSLRGCFSGLTSRHGPSHMARAVLEGVAFSLVDAFSVFQACGVEFAGASVVGGGCRNPVLVGALSDAFGKPLVLREESDSSLGAALLAIEGMTGAQAHVRTRVDAVTIHPDRTRHELYRRLIPVYVDFASALRNRGRASAGNADAARGA